MKNNDGTFICLCKKCNKEVIVKKGYNFKYAYYLDTNSHDVFCDKCYLKVEKVILQIINKEKKFKETLKSFLDKESFENDFKFYNQDCVWYTNVYQNIRFYMNFKQLRWIVNENTITIIYKLNYDTITLILDSKGKIININEFGSKYNRNRYFKKIFK